MLSYSGAFREPFAKGHFIVIFIGPVSCCEEATWAVRETGFKKERIYQLM